MSKNQHTNPKSTYPTIHPSLLKKSTSLQQQQKYRSLYAGDYDVDSPASRPPSASQPASVSDKSGGGRGGVVGRDNTAIGTSMFAGFPGIPGIRGIGYFPADLQHQIPYQIPPQNHFISSPPPSLSPSRSRFNQYYPSQLPSKSQIQPAYTYTCTCPLFRANCPVCIPLRICTACSRYNCPKCFPIQWPKPPPGYASPLAREGSGGCPGCEESGCKVRLREEGRELEWEKRWY